ncbi:MAG: nitroreductase [Anaerolineales bacterium]|nr:nitroreductase [Anaerolineales bacterium]
MDALEAIFFRQSIKNMRPDPVSRELLEKILAAGAQAPNHHKVRPWRFVVLQGTARDALGAVMAQALARRDPAALPEALAVERAKPLRAPVVIAVGVDKAVGPKVVEFENVCAAAAAAQNMLLAAHALGLGGMWRSGDAIFDPAVREALGFAADQPMVGFLYFGYSAAEVPPPARPGAEDRTVWRGE